MSNYRNDKPYQFGVACAISGGSLEANPYLDGEPLHFIQWPRGFRDHQTFDPACLTCGGTGKRKLIASTSFAIPSEHNYDGVEIACDCNVQSSQ